MTAYFDWCRKHKHLVPGPQQGSVVVTCIHVKIWDIELFKPFYMVFLTHNALIIRCSTLRTINSRVLLQCKALWQLYGFYMPHMSIACSIIYTTSCVDFHIYVWGRHRRCLVGPHEDQSNATLQHSTLRLFELCSRDKTSISEEIERAVTQEDKTYQHQRSFFIHPPFLHISYLTLHPNSSKSNKSHAMFTQNEQ